MLPPASSQATVRPAYVPESHWDTTAGKVKDEAALATFINEHIAFKAAEDSRRLTLPAKAEDFKPVLPKDFKAPQGMEFKVNEADPLMGQAKAFALKHGLSQDAFSELLALDAASKIGSEQNIANVKKAEVDKLGVNGPARKTAVDTWLKAQLGDDLGAEMSKFTFTAKQVEAIEALISKWTTQGIASPSAPSREPPNAPGKVSDEEWKRMTPSEKLNYASKFPQSTANGHA